MLLLGEIDSYSKTYFLYNKKGLQVKRQVCQEFPEIIKSPRIEYITPRAEKRVIKKLLFKNRVISIILLA